MYDLLSYIIFLNLSHQFPQLISSPQLCLKNISVSQYYEATKLLSAINSPIFYTLLRTFKDQAPLTVSETNTSYSLCPAYMVLKSSLKSLPFALVGN